MTTALYAEWTKLRTVAGPGWLLLAVIVSTVALSTVTAATLVCPPSGCDVDAVKLSLTGVQLGQVIVAVLAVLVVGGEYGTGMIRTTLTAMPRRGIMLAAKAVTLLGPVLAAGAVAAVGSLLAGRFVLAHDGQPAPVLTDGATVRATAGTVLYLGLIALLSLGIATLVRDSATAIGLVLGLLFLFPLLAGLVTDADWERRLRQLSPSNAGLAIQDTVGLDSLPIGPWAGLGVLALWAGAAVLAAGLTLRLRDA